MIKIRKGTQILNVPASSYEEFYQSAGWVILRKKSEVSPWEQEIKSYSLAQLKKLAKDKGIEIAGASKRSLIEAIIAQGK